MGGLKNAHRLHNNGTACRVVHSPGATLPGIQMRANHHKLIAPIRAEDFRDDVEGTGGLMKRGGGRDAQFHGDAMAYETHQPVVLLGLDDDGRRTGLSHFGRVSTPNDAGVRREILIANAASNLDSHAFTRKELSSL